MLGLGKIKEKPKTQKKYVNMKKKIKKMIFKNNFPNE